MKISNNPKDSNHLYRKKKNGRWYWHWQVFHSSAGLAKGIKKTKKEAIIAARLAALLMLCH